MSKLVITVLAENRWNVVGFLLSCVVWLAGCSKGPSPEASLGARVPPDLTGNSGGSNRPVPTNWVSLNSAQRSELARAVNQYALKGAKGLLPAVVQDLKPIEVYRRHVNVVIAMRREQGEEVGYYIQPLVSSFDISGEPSPEWSFLPLSGADEAGTVCYAYRRWLVKK